MHSADAPDINLPPAALTRAVLQCYPQAIGLPWHPLTGGRSNHLWRVGDWAVKRYLPGSESPLFPNDPIAEAKVLDHLADTGLAPRLRGFGEGWLAYDFVSGELWQEDVVSVAKAFARLHSTLALGTDLRKSPNGREALLADTRKILAQCRADLAVPEIPEAVATTPALIHGDAVPGNIICGAHGLTLIDWQCPALGDPVDDLAVFLSPAMQWLYRGKPLSENEKRSFLAAYPNQDTVARYHLLRPLLHARIAAHCLWKSERGAADYATALGLELAT